MRKYILMMLIVALCLNVFGSYAESYHSSVFYPNGVKYHIYLSYDHSETVENQTYTYNLTIEADVSLVSKDMTINYVGWGFDINFSMVEFENGEKKREESQELPIPPIFIAVKKNTREIHPTDVLMEFLTSGMPDINIPEIISDTYTANPVEDVYIYNFFYIESNHQVGDKIIFGSVNKSSNQKHTFDITITDEKDLQFDFGTIKTLVLEVSLDDLDIPEDVFGDSENLTTEAILRAYYEKRIGWLVKADISGSFNNTDENRSETGSVSGLVELVDMGTIQLINQDYLSRALGLPSYSFVAVAIIVVIAVVYSKILRRSPL